MKDWLPLPTRRPADKPLRDDVRWLADDAREGRRAGTEGERAAAAWIAERFAAAGFKGALTGESYEQLFQRELMAPDAADCELSVAGEAEPREPHLDIAGQVEQVMAVPVARREKAGVVRAIRDENLGVGETHQFPGPVQVTFVCDQCDATAQRSQMMHQ